MGRGCPPPQQGRGLGRGPETFNFLPRNGAFFEHSDTIRQFTRPVAITLKACKKRRRPCQRQVLGRACPPPNKGKGLGRESGSAPPQNFFNFLPRNGAFFEHSDTIRQFTRPVLYAFVPHLVNQDIDNLFSL